MTNETRNKKQETRNKKQEIISSSNDLCQVKIDVYKNIIVINPEPDSVSRTIKAQYYKNSLANILREGTFGCTGVIQCIE